MKPWDPSLSINDAFDEVAHVGTLRVEETTTIGFEVDIDPATVTPRMVACLLLWHADSRGLKEILECIVETEQFYRSIDREKKLLPSFSAPPNLQAKVEAPSMRPAFEFSE